MKRIIRIIAAVMCIALLGVTLCSCQQLDDKKRNHAVYTDDSKETIEFRGNAYKRLTLPSETISATAFYDYIPESAYVTTKDVPVLLSSMFGEPIIFDTKSDDPVIIQCYNESPITTENSYYLNSISNYYGYQFDAKKCYVREDFYDELKEELKDGNLEHYFYYDYDLKDFDMKNFDPENIESAEEFEYDMYSNLKVDYKLIDDELTKAINDTLKSGKKIDYKKLKDHSYSSFALSYCDKNLIVSDEGKNLVIFCDTKTNKYYLAPMAYGYSNNKVLIEVPDKYSQLFKKLFTEQKDSLFEDEDLSMYFEDDLEDYTDEEDDSSETEL